MSLLVLARVHGLSGSIDRLRAVLLEHAAAVAGAPGSEGCTAYEPLGGEPAEFVIVARWAGEDAMRAHYASAEYARYSGAVAELLARPSDVEILHVDRSTRPVADLSLDPTRQD